MSRPAKPDSLRHHVAVYVSKRTRDEWYARAREAGLSLSDWVRRKVEGVPTVKLSESQTVN